MDDFYPLRSFFLFFQHMHLSKEDHCQVKVLVHAYHGLLDLSRQLHTFRIYQTSNNTLGHVDNVKILQY